MRELRLQLTREKPGREHTFGQIVVLETGEVLCWTMEPGTNDRDFPRVPTGFYALVPHTSPRAWIGDTFALVGENVSQHETAGVDRYAVLFHAGNTDDDTEGCIIPGLRRGRLGADHAVLSSKSALDRLLERIRGADRAFLHIR